MENDYNAYDSQTLACLAGFESLWQRVADKAPEKRPAEENRLLDFFREESCAASFYAGLARLFQNPGRGQLAARAAEAQRRARRLRAEYFILTGLSCDSPRDCPSAGGKLVSLRTALETERRLARAYALAAESASCTVLKELYQDYARESALCAEANRALLLDCF